MNLRDATLMLASESTDHPDLHQAALAVYDALADGSDVPYQALQEIIGEASGKGVLRAMRRKYSQVAFEAIVGPILSEIGRSAPIGANPRGPGRHYKTW